MKRSLAAIFTATLIGVGATAIAAKKSTNRQVIDRFFEIVDGKKFDRLGEVDAPGLVVKMPLGVVNGLEGHKQVLQGFATAFPNFKHSSNRCFEVGEAIACEGTFSGDHTGPMMMPDGKAVPPTHKHVEFAYAGVARVKDDKITELRIYFDMMTFMQQLGLLAPPAKTASR